MNEVPEVGFRVRVSHRIDANTPESYVGCEGEVTELFPWAGNPGDPLIEVKFDDGESFPYWKEELEPPLDAEVILPASIV